MDYLTRHFEVKASGDGDGTIFGYGSMFGNVDTYGDTIFNAARSFIAMSAALSKSNCLRHSRVVYQCDERSVRLNLIKIHSRNPTDVVKTTRPSALFPYLLVDTKDCNNPSYTLRQRYNGNRYCAA